MQLDDWFLTAEERGNPASQIDGPAGAHVAWTDHNDVRRHIDGASYFASLAGAVESLGRGDEVHFTDWRGDGDELLTDEGVSLRELMSRACRRDVTIRGLLWRSHSDRLAFSAKENRRFAEEVSAAGGQVLLDNRVRRGGSHHQKLVVLRHLASPEDDVAFVGGIDLSHGRRDDVRHGGDVQVIELDARYGPRPPWHDVQLEIRGPAIDQLDTTFRERWNDPTPLTHVHRLRSWISRVSTTRTRDPRPHQITAPDATPPTVATLSVQVLRTYPVRRPHYPFAPTGERSVARAFAKAVQRARSLIYIEDQYFWSVEIARILATALRRRPELQLVVVVPRFPDKDGRLSGPPSRLAQKRALDIVRAAGGARVGVYDVQNQAGRPIYVHAKVCVIDDVWATVGSDNLNRRSWTHDSELSCAVIDSRRDERAPVDPGGLGDGARTFARELRLSLWAEHLDRSADDPALVALAGSTRLWKEAALRDAGADSTKRRDASGSRVCMHHVDPVARGSRLWAEVVYRLVFDPDGRPWQLRLRRCF